MGHGGRPRLLRRGPCVRDLAGVGAAAGSSGGAPPRALPPQNVPHRGELPGQARPLHAPKPSFLLLLGPVMGENDAGGCAGTGVPSGRRETVCGLHELWGKRWTHSRVCAFQQRGKPGQASWGLAQALRVNEAGCEVGGVYPRPQPASWSHAPGPASPHSPSCLLTQTDPPAAPPEGSGVDVMEARSQKGLLKVTLIRGSEHQS